MDGTGSGSCPRVGFAINGTEPSGFTMKELVTAGN
jgi:hypothetical protein